VVEKIDNTAAKTTCGARHRKNTTRSPPYEIKGDTISLEALSVYAKETA
jgi:hypothetical protein